MLDLAALQATPAYTEPFPFVIVPNFITAQGLAAVEKDYPEIGLPGSFPLETLKYGPGFSKLMSELRGEPFSRLMGQKLGIDLSSKPTTITVRGRARAKDGQIHLDSRTKLVTVLIYMNGEWEADGGRLRLLKSPDDLDDVLVEVPPAQGTLLAFLNTENAWHGHKSFEGERRVIQLNWVRDNFVVWREKTRHRVSAFIKKLKQ